MPFTEEEKHSVNLFLEEKTVQCSSISYWISK